MSRSSSLLIIRGIDQGARFELDEEETSIGRGARNRLRILDTEMSRNHAVLRYVDDGWLLVDRNSSNGTFVNGLSVKSHRLSSGDQIQFGRTVLLFSEQAPAKQAVSVEIVSPAGANDASQIVSRADRDAGRKLLERSVSSRTDQASRTLANLELLYRISEETVSSTLSIEQLLQRILDKTLESVGAERGCMLVSDPRTGQLQPRAVTQRVGRSNRMPVSHSIVDYVLRQGQGVRTSDARADSRFAAGASIVREGIREAMCVPMPGRYELMGVIYVDTTSPSSPLAEGFSEEDHFNDDHLHLLAAIGRQAALAVEDHRFRSAFVHAERFAAVGQTITILSHHIKNILQGVRGGSYLIDMGLKNHDEALIKQGWSVVEKNQDRIFDLVTDMLTFSKERQPKLEPGSINEVVSDVCELMNGRSDEVGVELRMVLDHHIPTAMFDAEGIHRAILNIVLNAIEAVEGQDHGVVEVKTSRSDDESELIIDITDNGPGIPDDQRESIFSLFESTKGARGTGIGLAVSQKIIREHGGQILLDSQPQRGTRFRLTWPAHEDEGRSSSRGTVST